MSDPNAERYDFADFTEEAYDEMLGAAAETYSFEPFGTDAEGPHALWRHDVDFSVHRALALARIEADRGVRATYFISLHSELYNLLEPAVTERARAIFDLGNWAGLHFDASLDPGSPAEERAARERELLSRTIGRPVDALSFHNPEVQEIPFLREERVAGMVNAYGESIGERYEYVSDSNGYWRHSRLPDVLAEGKAERLHVLTHPEWWQPQAMSPRERLERCIEGRSAAVRDWYDGLLESEGRDNVR